MAELSAQVPLARAKAPTGKSGRRSRNGQRKGEAQQATAAGLDLLRVLAQHAGQVVTRNQLLSFVWGAGERRDSQVLRVLVGQLRQKIEADPRVPALLLTEPGIGYRLRAEGEDE